MERMNEALIQKQFLYDEHYARYKHFSHFMKGKVIDCACGIGYASKVVLSCSNVDSYLGVDVSQEAVQLATKNFFIKDKADFVTGNICDLEYVDHSFDTFISMETLEHLETPNLAIKEIKRVLKGNGVFIGSVPIDNYDEKCEEVYGENIYHIKRFNENELKRLLSNEFKYIYLGKITREIVSRYEGLSTCSKGLSTEIINNDYNNDHGSFLFICSNEALEIDIIDKIYLSQSLVEYDQEQLMPVFNAMKYAEKLALDRDEIANNTELAYQNRINALQAALDNAEDIALQRFDMLQKVEVVGINESLKNILYRVKERILLLINKS